MTSSKSPRARRVALLVATVLALASASAATAATRELLPRGGDAARGVRIDGHALAPGDVAREVIAEVAAARLDAPLRVVDAEGHVLLTTTARELGATFDATRAERDALGVGRRGDLAARLVDAWRARRDGAQVPLALEVPAAALAERLAEAKESLDTRARSARRDAAAGSITPHVEGRWVDAFATAERIQQAITRPSAPGAEATQVEVAFRAVMPAATTEVARALDARAELARFETRFGGPPGRDRNIARAATALDGVVLMPGEEVSFNAEVGPRSTDNGFFKAPEIYRGEMREGIGGGACQVASTLYAAALFAGLDVTERRNHSRPSGYIRPGLDATVSYPVLDLRVRNTFDFPVVLDTAIEAGVMRARVLGAERPVEVDLATETAGVSKFKRKVERAAWLAEGGAKLKQKGKNGMSIRRKVRVRDRTGSERVITSLDVYPPTQEIWLLAPGADPEAVLPPLPEADTGVRID